MGADDTTQPLWRTSYNKQFTRQMLHDLIKRVTALIKRYERFMPRKSTDTAEDRINTAVLKLFAGSRIWDPTRVDLAGFLTGVVASDLSTEMERTTKATFVSLDDNHPTREDDYTGDPIDEAEADIDVSVEIDCTVPIAPTSIDDAWLLALTQLRSRAGTNADVLALLAAWEEGVMEKREVMTLLGWTARKYKTVFDRLKALATTLDESVRDALIH